MDYEGESSEFGGLGCVEIALILLAAGLWFSGRGYRSVWCREWLKRRDRLGAYHSLLQELRNEDPHSFRNFLRMDENTFNLLLRKVKPLIQRQNTNYRRSIPAAERLALTLRYLATGDSFRSLQFLYRISIPAISKIIPDVCAAIYKVLKDEFMKVPDTEAEWVAIGSAFMEKWNFPHVLGAIDGKHIRIRAPSNCGSTYFNYKGFHSIVLLALVDANYKFIYVDIGGQGRISDGGVFRHSTLFKAIHYDKLHTPRPAPLSNWIHPMPYVIVGDDAFPLSHYLMKPYARKDLDDDELIFNYRLSRARRVAENAFGIMGNRFRVFHTPINLKRSSIKKVVMACCCLHNFLLSKPTAAAIYAPPGVADREIVNMDSSSIRIEEGSWRGEVNPFRPIGRQPQGRPLRNAQAIRENLREYFFLAGGVPWQWDKV